MAESFPLVDDVVEASVDHRGLPVRRSTSGGWRSASFIIGVEVAERFCYYGISSNLVTYFTEMLGQSTATAAVNVNVWSGTAWMLPLLGAFVADAYLGRYPTIIIASLIYILGLGLLTLSSALLISSLGSTSGQIPEILFMVALYLVALGQGGHKPCVQAFGADQFDGGNEKESRAKASFFNWWNCTYCLGITLSLLLVVYIEDYISWVLAFGFLSLFMIAALFIFLIGTTTYRYPALTKSDNPFSRVGRVFFAAIKNWFWGKKALVPSSSDEVEGNRITVDDIEDAKSLLRLIPIWTTCLVYSIVYAQTATLFTKQGATMDRTISPGFSIPSASLQCFISITISALLPIYDRVFVPLARAFNGNPSGITVLQRIGVGILFCAASMVAAALVETKRLRIARTHGLINNPNTTVPMSVWWLVPQYVLYGVCDVFTVVGLQELFYDQVPKDLRSLGVSLYLAIVGVGSFISGILVSIIDKVTSSNGGDSWFHNNLNRAHLDYFYWLLAALCVLAFPLYLYFSKSFRYITSPS